MGTFKKLLPLFALCVVVAAVVGIIMAGPKEILNNILAWMQNLVGIESSKQFQLAIGMISSGMLW